MSFLQPLLLAALPLVALPILIHLINQRRYQSTPWGAMMFLLAANRMSRGYARIRRWLILAMRALAIAGLIFAISRPLASGWLGLTAGSRADTTIIVLDRSPSMSQRGTGNAISKLETGRRQLVDSLSALGSDRWVLIENTKCSPQEIESPDALLDMPNANATSMASDLPAMLQAARDYIRDNKTGRTEIWICSDLRENDWDASGGRWPRLRDEFVEMAQGVRFHLLAYPRAAPENIAVRVTKVERRETNGVAELQLSLRVRRDEPSNDVTTVPLRFEIDGARSEVSVELAGQEYELADYRIPLGANQKRGWARVSIPADANPSDNEFYFVFDEPPVRRTMIVADDPSAVRPLELAAGIAPSPFVTCEAEVVSLEQLPAVAWDDMALVLWQAAAPSGADAVQMQSFVDRGGQVIFFPPRSPNSDAMFGVHWTEWADADDDLAIETWRGDQDVLANTQSGESLPVGQLRVTKFCGLSGKVTPLASLRSGAPLLAKVTTDHGGVFFFTTTPSIANSSLATSGVVLYVVIQRALAEGANALGDTRQLVAGEADRVDLASWRQLAGGADALSTEYAIQQGAYSAGEELFAVNQSVAEEESRVLQDDEIAPLFAGLEFIRLDDQAGSRGTLVHEIWRMFLGAMMLALLAEAILCLPKLRGSSAAESQPAATFASGFAKESAA